MKRFSPKVPLIHFTWLEKNITNHHTSFKSRVINSSIPSRNATLLQPDALLVINLQKEIIKLCSISLRSSSKSNLLCRRFTSSAITFPHHTWLSARFPAISNQNRWPKGCGWLVPSLPLHFSNEIQDGENRQIFAACNDVWVRYRYTVIFYCQ